MDAKSQERCHREKEEMWLKLGKDHYQCRLEMRIPFREKGIGQEEDWNIMKDVDSVMKNDEK